MTAIKSFPRQAKISFITLFLGLLIASIFILSTTIAQDKYKEGETPSYQDLKYKTDLEFAKLLKSDWQKMESIPGLVADREPKPPTIPRAKLTDQDIETLKSTYSQSREIRDISPPQAASAAEPIPSHKPVPAEIQKTETLRFAFFGAPIELNYDPELRVPLGHQVNNMTISTFWESICAVHYDDLLAQAGYYRDKMTLNDWGYYLFLQKISENIDPGSPNDARLLTWFLLVKSGYDAKIGYGDGQVYLLLPSPNVLYNVPYFTIGGKDYYLASTATTVQRPGSLHIYEGNYPGSDRPMSVKVERSPNIEKAVAKRSLTFNHQGNAHTVEVEYNKTTVDFFDDYPQTDLDIYFDAPVSNQAALSLAGDLKPLIAGKSEAEAVNILLHFVQTAFQYKTDKEQFGREKYFFPEETLYYAYCDCEDRAVLFSYLVRNLTGLEVIGLDYPGHVAAAVKFSDDIPGDNVLYQGQIYLICDPTYLDANIGMCMPRYKNVSPTIISISV